MEIVSSSVFPQQLVGKMYRERLKCRYRLQAPHSAKKGIRQFECFSVATRRKNVSRAPTAQMSAAQSVLTLSPFSSPPSIFHIHPLSLHRRHPKPAAVLVPDKNTHRLSESGAGLHQSPADFYRRDFSG